MIFGLKLWSINTHFIKYAQELYDEGICSFVELSAFPNDFEKTASMWAKLKLPFVIHAPHFMQGLNFSDKSREKYNMKLAAEAKRFADKLDAEFIIFHPGIAGDAEETVRQMAKLNDGRVLVENKPYIVPKDAIEKANKNYEELSGQKSIKIGGEASSDNICVGYSPEQIKAIIEGANVGFCLDIGHCFCAANGVWELGSFGEPKSAGDTKSQLRGRYVSEFLALAPKMFHISDGETDSPYDKHEHFGAGDYDFKAIGKIFKANERKKITIETKKDSMENLDDFKKDILKLRALVG